MLHAFSRSEELLGKEGLKRLSETKIAVFGIGGVGSYVVDKVSDPLFLEQVCTNSDYLRQELQRLNDKYHVFQEIRGRGFLIGAELAPEYAGKLSTLQKLCTKHQLLVLTAGSNVLRLTPALIITKRIIDEAMVLLERAIQDLVAESKE